MIWRTLWNRPKFLMICSFGGGILIVFSLIMQGAIFFFVGILLFLLGFFPEFYLRHVIKHLSLENKPFKKRMLVGENDELSFVLRNDSKLPVIRAQCYIKPGELLKVTDERLYKTDIPLHPFSKTTVKIPIHAVKRGWGRIQSLQLTVYDPFHLASVILTYDLLIHTEIIIYPRQLAFSRLNELKKLSGGDVPQRSSLFFDYTQILGIRDYEPMDPLKYVHWKASARTGQLQTKLYEKVSGIYWTIVFIINNEDANKLSGEEVEKALSHAAYMTQFAEKHGIAFEIYFNVKSRPGSSGMYLEMDTGKNHLMKTWEVLALYKLSYIRINPVDAWAYLDRKMTAPRTVFLFLSDPHSASYSYQWKKKGHQIFRVTDSGAMIGVNGSFNRRREAALG